MMTRNKGVAKVLWTMRIISKKKLREFWGANPRAKSALEAWYQIAKHANWQNFAGVRQAFNSAEKVGKFVVFNIGGNKYRLIAAIHFDRGRLYIRQVLTHAEYDKGKWKDE
jgi:mRNA interferase HigB